MPLEVFSQILPPFKNVNVVMEFLNTFDSFSPQTCCTDEKMPCGEPTCGIRACVQEQGFRTCGECAGYADCAKLDFLKPHHPSLLADLQAISEQGLDHYITEVVSKFQLDRIIIE